MAWPSVRSRCGLKCRVLCHGHTLRSVTTVVGATKVHLADQNSALRVVNMTVDRRCTHCRPVHVHIDWTTFLPRVNRVTMILPLLHWLGQS